MNNSVILKKEIKMEFKGEIDNIVKKYHPAVKKAGVQLTKALREAEDELARIYKTAHAQVEIQMTKLQKEKLYHSIGKEVAGMILSGELELPAFDKYMEQLKSFEDTTQKKKNAIIAISRTKRKKNSSKKV